MTDPTLEQRARDVVGQLQGYVTAILLRRDMSLAALAEDMSDAAIFITALLARIAELEADRAEWVEVDRLKGEV